MIKRNIQTIFMFLMAVMMITLISCDPSKKYEKEERDNIQAYLTNNPTLNFVLKPSGLYYLDVEVGTGSVPEKHDTAYIKYTGKFLNGTIFDSNVDILDSLKFAVDEGRLISGFDEGITYMRVGGKAMFLVPSSLAYGKSGKYPYIEGYTPLLFDVELLKVKPAPGK